MSSLNKVMLIGNVGIDLKLDGEVNKYTVLSIATSESWKDKNTGSKMEKTEWHRVVFFGKQAETLCQYVKKGMKLYIEGKLTTRKYKDKEGKERYMTEVIGNEFKFLISKGDAEKPVNQGSYDYSSIPAPSKSEFDQDIPF